MHRCIMSCAVWRVIYRSSFLCKFWCFLLFYVCVSCMVCGSISRRNMRHKLLLWKSFRHKGKWLQKVKGLICSGSRHRRRSLPKELENAVSVADGGSDDYLQQQGLERTVQVEVHPSSSGDIWSSLGYTYCIAKAHNNYGIAKAAYNMTCSSNVHLHSKL